LQFNKLHCDIKISCIGEDTPENTSDFFVRRIDKNKLREKDFLSHWERGIKPDPKDEMDRKKVCGKKGISCYLYNDNDYSIEKKLINTMRIVSKFKRKLGKFFCKLRFKKNAGRIWKNGRNSPYHCDFYKSDGFSLDLVEVIEIKPLERR
jgi:hypothetical protein